MKHLYPNLNRSAMTHLLAFLILALLFSACAAPAPTATTTSTETPRPAGAASFPLTITDASGQEFTFDKPVKIGCWWSGCTEIFADLGLVAYAASYSEEEATSAFLYPNGLPEHLVKDFMNPEEWAAAAPDILIMRMPPAADQDALKAAAPIFYLHHPSYGESSQKGYHSYLENLRLVGQLVDKPEAASAAVTRFENVVANLKALATPETKAQTVAVLWDDPAYRMIDNTNPFCVAIAEIGLGQCIAGPLWDEISAETFLAADPDWIAYQSFGAARQERTDPVWSQLSAVKAGHVYDSTGYYYCCGARNLIFSLQEYAHHVLPAANIPDPGLLKDFDPLQSPLINPPAAAATTRQVVHELGTTEVPVNPQRIVALHDLSIANNMLQLGVVPVGAANREEARSIGKFVLPASVAPVGTIPEPNLEQIAALKPDLIICLNTHAKIYDQLSAIAPTVVVRDYSATDALAAQRTIAELIGKTDLFNEQVAAYEARVAALRERLAPLQPALEVSAFGIYDPNLYITHQIGWTHAKVFADLGLVTPPVITELIGAAEDQSASLSYEELPKLDSDVIFVIDPAWEDGLGKVQATGLLDLTFAGRAGQIFVVDANHWYRGGIAGLNLVLDDVEKYLLDRELDTSADFR